MGRCPGRPGLVCGPGRVCKTREPFWCDATGGDTGEPVVRFPLFVGTGCDHLENRYNIYRSNRHSSASVDGSADSNDHVCGSYDRPTGSHDHSACRNDCDAGHNDESAGSDDPGSGCDNHCSGCDDCSAGHYNSRLSPDNHGRNNHCNDFCDPDNNGIDHSACRDIDGGRVDRSDLCADQ